MQHRTFTTVSGEPAYLLITGPITGPVDQPVYLGVLVGVSLGEAERTATTMRHPEPVRVLSLPVVKPPPPDVGVVVFGAETALLPVGSMIEPLPPAGQSPPPPTPPLLRTAEGWQSTAGLAWNEDLEPIVPAAGVPFRVMFRGQEQQ